MEKKLNFILFNILGTKILSSSKYMKNLKKKFKNVIQKY